MALVPSRTLWRHAFRAASVSSSFTMQARPSSIIASTITNNMGATKANSTRDAPSRRPFPKRVCLTEFLPRARVGRPAPAASPLQINSSASGGAPMGGEKTNNRDTQGSCSRGEGEGGGRILLLRRIRQDKADVNRFAVLIWHRNRSGLSVTAWTWGGDGVQRKLIVRPQTGDSVVQLPGGEGQFRGQILHGMRAFEEQ